MEQLKAQTICSGVIIVVMFVVMVIAQEIWVGQRGPLAMGVYARLVVRDIIVGSDRQEDSCSFFRNLNETSVRSYNYACSFLDGFRCRRRNQAQGWCHGIKHLHLGRA